MVKTSDQAPSSPSSPAGACKYKGVRKRKWGKYVSEIRLPNCRQRIWLGSYDTAQKAARAFDAALFCLRGRNAKFNFPDSPPDILNAPSMTPAQIQAAAAQFARDSGRVDIPESVSETEQSRSSSLSPEMPLDSSGILDYEFLLNMGGGNDCNNVADFGLYPGFDDFSGEFMLPPWPSVDTWPDNTADDFSPLQDNFLWNF